MAVRQHLLSRSRLWEGHWIVGDDVARAVPSGAFVLVVAKKGLSFGFEDGQHATCSIENYPAGILTNCHSSNWSMDRDLKKTCGRRRDGTWEFSILFQEALVRERELRQNQQSYRVHHCLRQTYRDEWPGLECKNPKWVLSSFLHLSLPVYDDQIIYLHFLSCLMRSANLMKQPYYADLKLSLFLAHPWFAGGTRWNLLTIFRTGTNGALSTLPFLSESNNFSIARTWVTLRSPGAFVDVEYSACVDKSSRKWA